MKTLQQHIEEKLVLQNNTKIRKNKYHPATKEELVEIIKSEVEKNGWECDLNHIDVSEITDMSHLFCGSKKNGHGLSNFNGDISQWDVSNVKNMKSMFNHAYSFNQPIGNWDVSNVINMECMFCCAESFNQDISKWDVSNVTDMGFMFFSAESFDQDISGWKLNENCDCKFMFDDCLLKEEFKPKGI
jgi:surface protein